jgi:trehalose 6-phosphate phosphatase
MILLDDATITRLHTRDAEGQAQTPPPPLRPDTALYLDFDGTLVDIAARPDLVRLERGQAELLALLLDVLDGAVAVISGRRLESIDACLEPLRLCGAGLHGAQLRRHLQADTTEPDIPTIGRLAGELRDAYRDDPRILVEDKSAAVALHYRDAPERAAECQSRMRQSAAAHGLDVITGHYVVEARPAGIDKGVGLRQLHTIAPFQGRTPVFVGDDTTDEDAIIAAQALGGIGIRVGSAPSQAMHRLPDVAAVLDWLHRSADGLRRSA